MVGGGNDNMMIFYSIFDSIICVEFMIGIHRPTGCQH